MAIRGRLTTTPYGEEMQIAVNPHLLRCKSTVNRFLSMKHLPEVPTIMKALHTLHHPTISRYQSWDYQANHAGFSYTSDAFLPTAKPLVFYIVHPTAITLTQKVIILIGIATGLRYLHSRDVIHGCLTPASVIVGGFVDEMNDTALEPHLVSYGLHSLLLVRGRTVGQLLYFSPDVLRGVPFSKASDLYSFGFLAWMLLCPSARSVVGELAPLKLFSGFPPNFSDSNFPPPIKQLLEACCHENARSRPTIGEVVKKLRGKLDTFGSAIDQPEILKYLSRLDEFDASEQLRLTAEGGDVNALYRYGKKALDEIAWTADANPFRFLSRAADGPSPDAQYLYGRLLIDGYFGEAMRQFGSGYIEQAAEKGRTRAIEYLRNNPIVRLDSRALRRMPMSMTTDVVSRKRVFQKLLVQLLDETTLSAVYEEIKKVGLDSQLLVSSALDVVTVRPAILASLIRILRQFPDIENILVQQIFHRLHHKRYPHEVVCYVRLLRDFPVANFSRIWDGILALPPRNVFTLTALLACFADNMKSMDPGFERSVSKSPRTHLAVERYFAGESDVHPALAAANINRTVLPSIRDPFSLLFADMSYFQYWILTRAVTPEQIEEWEAKYRHRRWSPTLIECAIMTGDIHYFTRLKAFDARADGVLSTAARFFVYLPLAETTDRAPDRMGHLPITSAAATNNLNALCELLLKGDPNHADARGVCFE
jgi:serine/threonine protein kinase